MSTEFYTTPRPQPPHSTCLHSRGVGWGPAPGGTPYLVPLQWLDLVDAANSGPCHYINSASRGAGGWGGCRRAQWMERSEGSSAHKRSLKMANRTLPFCPRTKEMVDKAAPPLHPTAAAAGPTTGLSLSAVRAYVVQLVPQLIEELVDGCLTAPEGEAVRFHCPCYSLRHKRHGGGGAAPCAKPWVVVIDKQKLVQHLNSKTHTACKCL